MASQLLIVCSSQLWWFLGACVDRTNPDTNSDSSDISCKQAKVTIYEVDQTECLLYMS